ncbi:MAG: hypothetical protein ACLTCB_03785 [Merdibacter sp.]
MDELKMTREWDKVFPKSDSVDHDKITFHNRYGITLAADRYLPKTREGRLPAIAYAALRRGEEQASGCMRRSWPRWVDDRVRSFLYRRKRRHAPRCGLPGHQHRGFLRGRRLPEHMRRSRS